MNEHRTRYGDLTRQAALHLTAAAALVTGEPFSGLSAASAAITAYRDLHDAVYRLGWQLRGGTITQALVPEPVRRDPRETATLDLLEQVGRVATRSHATRVPRVGAAGDWHRAAVQLRAATDLLATHHTPTGGPRSPDSPNLTDPAVAGPAWRDYTSLVLAAATVAEPLAVRSRAAGITAARVRGLPWAGDRLTTTARHLRALTNLTGAGTGAAIADLQVAHPPVRSGDPLLELTDRLHRIQAAAWEHTTAGTLSVQSLTDLAAAGVLLHAAAHRTLTSEPVADPATVDLIATHGTAWRAVHAELAELRGIDPVPGGIRCDLNTIMRLLPEAETDPRHDRAAAVLVDACRSHDRVAEWSATAVADLAARGGLYLPGRTLTGDDLTDDTERAAAKLAGTPTTTTPRRIDNILANLATAARPDTEHEQSDYAVTAKVLVSHA